MRVQHLSGGITRYTFEEIQRSRVVRATCTVCGKKRQRTFNADQTVNPYNKNDDGSVKSRDQVIAAVEAELDNFCAEPFRCATCYSTWREAERDRALDALASGTSTASDTKGTDT